MVLERKELLNDPLELNHRSGLALAVVGNAVSTFRLATKENESLCHSFWYCRMFYTLYITQD